MMKNIEKGALTKNMYYELGLIISVAIQRGIALGKTGDFEEVVDRQDLDDFTQLANKCTEDISVTSADFVFNSRLSFPHTRNTH